MRTLFTEGEKVLWSRNFLRSVGDYSKDSADRVGTVVEPNRRIGDKPAVTVKWEGDEDAHLVRSSCLIGANERHLEPA